MNGQRRFDLESWWVNKMPFALVENPFELFVAVLAFIGGLPYMFGIVRSTSVDSLLPNALVFFWGVQLVLGSVLVVIGLLRRMIYVEMAGLSMLAVTAIIYAASVLYFVGVTGLLTTAIIGAFSIACASRVFLLRAAVKIRRRALNHGD